MFFWFNLSLSDIKTNCLVNPLLTSDIKPEHKLFNPLTRLTSNRVQFSAARVKALLTGRCKRCCCAVSNQCQASTTFYFAHIVLVL